MKKAWSSSSKMFSPSQVVSMLHNKYGHEKTHAYQILSDSYELGVLPTSLIVSWPSNGNDLDETLDGFDDAYQGYFSGSGRNPQVEYAYQYVEDTGMLSDVPQVIERYFDYEAFARDLFLEGYSEYEGHVFIDF